MVAVVPREIAQSVETLTGARILAFTFTGGGCINSGGKLTTSGGTYFLKWNDAGKFPGMFQAESIGLSLLRKTNSMTVPYPVHDGHAGSFQFLLLEFIHEGKKKGDYWAKFGSRLAALHKQSALAFGLDHNNYIGSLSQRNDQSASWIEFFVNCRLKAQVELARAHDKIDADLQNKFERLFERLPSLLTLEPPSLLHGDLWGGNLLVDAEGNPCLIDPAVYYGHREADLAMTQLFGGFDPEFLECYHAEFPLTPGYRERFEIYNLYSLLVHLNLFGIGYRSGVVSIIDRFV
jgi:fructosamine-3-kinase